MARLKGGPHELAFIGIDGTLAIGRNVPESYEQAITQTRTNGHQVFICTGRSGAYAERLDMGLPWETQRMSARPRRSSWPPGAYPLVAWKALAVSAFDDMARIGIPLHPRRSQGVVRTGAPARLRAANRTGLALQLEVSNRGKGKHGQVDPPESWLNEDRVCDPVLTAHLSFSPTYERPREFEPHRHALHTQGPGCDFICARCAPEPGAWQKLPLGALQNRGLGRASRVVRSGASVAAVSSAWCTRFRATVHQAKTFAQRDRTQRTARKLLSDAIRCAAPAV